MLLFVVKDFEDTVVVEVEALLVGYFGYILRQVEGTLVGNGLVAVRLEVLIVTEEVSVLLGALKQTVLVVGLETFVLRKELLVKVAVH